MSPAKKQQSTKEKQAAQRARQERRTRQRAQAEFDASALGQAFGAAVDVVGRDPKLSPDTRRWYEHSIGVHMDYAMAYGLSEVKQFTFEIAQQAVLAPNDDGTPPATGTACGRATTGHRIFNIWHDLGLINENPALGRTLRIPRTPPCFVRPLFNAEMTECMRVVFGRGENTSTAAVFALCRAGGVGSEIAKLTVGDLNLGNGEVLFPGSKNTVARIVVLDQWGLDMVTRHLESHAYARKSYSGSTFGASTMANMVPTRALKEAGYWNPADGIKVGSVRLWAGAQEYERTGRIEDAARLLGLPSLDRTAQLLGLDWMPDIGKAYAKSRRRMR
jgi:integrase/recombinase XerC